MKKHFVVALGLVANGRAEPEAPKSHDGGDAGGAPAGGDERHRRAAQPRVSAAAPLSCPAPRGRYVPVSRRRRWPRSG